MKNLFFTNKFQRLIDFLLIEIEVERFYYNLFFRGSLIMPLILRAL